LDKRNNYPNLLYRLIITQILYKEIPELVLGLLEFSIKCIPFADVLVMLVMLLIAFAFPLNYSFAAQYQPLARPTRDQALVPKRDTRTFAVIIPSPLSMMCLPHQ
jgi:hypothetical protein